MTRTYNITLRIFAGFGFIVFCLIVVLFAITMWKAPLHQFNLWRLERNFQAIAPYHPADSNLLLKRKDFGGLFSGASNSCDYFVGEFRSAARSKEEITRSYNGLSIDSFDRTERIPIHVFPGKGVQDYSVTRLPEASAVRVEGKIGVGEAGVFTLALSSLPDRDVQRRMLATSGVLAFDQQLGQGS